MGDQRPWWHRVGEGFQDEARQWPRRFQYRFGQAIERQIEEQIEALVYSVATGTYHWVRGRREGPDLPGTELAPESTERASSVPPSVSESDPYSFVTETGHTVSYQDIPPERGVGDVFSDFSFKESTGDPGSPGLPPGGGAGVPDLPPLNPRVARAFNLNMDNRVVKYLFFLKQKKVASEVRDRCQEIAREFRNPQTCEGVVINPQKNIYSDLKTRFYTIPNPYQIQLPSDFTAGNYGILLPGFFGGMPQGAQEGERIGRKILVYGLTVRGTLFSKYTLNSVDTGDIETSVRDQYVRIALVMDKFHHIDDPIRWEKVFRNFGFVAPENMYNVLSSQNPSTAHQYDVLRDETIWCGEEAMMPWYHVTGVKVYGFMIRNWHYQVNWKVNFDPPLQVEFDENDYALGPEICMFGIYQDTTGAVLDQHRVWWRGTSQFFYTG